LILLINIDIFVDLYYIKNNIADAIMKKEKLNRIKKSFDLDEKAAAALRDEAKRQRVNEVDIIRAALKSYLDTVKYDEVMDVLPGLESKYLKSIKGFIEEILKERKRP